MNVPLCNGMEHKSRWSPAYWACSSMQAALHWGAYLPWVRDHIVQAQYFRVTPLPFIAHISLCECC